MRGLKWLGAVVAYYLVAFMLLIYWIVVAARAPDAANSGWQAMAIVYAFGIALLPIFLVPSLIAFWRRLPTRRGVLLFNVTLGFTGIGWIAALAYAILYNPKGVPIVIANTVDNPVPIRQVQSPANIERL